MELNNMGNRRMTVTGFRRFLKEQHICSFQQYENKHESFSDWAFVVNPNVFQLKGNGIELLFYLVRAFIITKLPDNGYDVEVLYRTIPDNVQRSIHLLASTI